MQAGQAKGPHNKRKENLRIFVQVKKGRADLRPTTGLEKKKKEEKEKRAPVRGDVDGQQVQSKNYQESSAACVGNESVDLGGGSQTTLGLPGQEEGKNGKVTRG